jgi:serine/threonine-protein kinase
MNPGERPSADVLADLMALSDVLDAAARQKRAWQLIHQAEGNDDFPVVIDYALDRGLIVAADRATAGASAITWVSPIDGSEMVWIPPGPFRAGTKKEPARCAGFSLGRFPVTNDQFGQFCRQTHYTPPRDHPDNDRFLSHWAKTGNPPDGLDDHPVVWVSYIDALHYCRWAGMTLPTEWLWEKAARGPHGQTYPWGDSTPSKQLANVRGSGTTPVGHYPRTRTLYGCEDLVGNVSEWCQTVPGDDHGFMPPTPPAIPAELSSGPGTYTVVRGACFLRLEPQGMHAAHRRRLSITRRNHWTGFRVAYLHPWMPAG